MSGSNTDDQSKRPEPKLQENHPSRPLAAAVSPPAGMLRSELSCWRKLRAVSFRRGQMHMTTTAITIGAGAHVLHGNLPLVGGRIQERLNDERSGTLRLSEVDVRSQLQQRSVAHLASALVPKSCIEYVLVNSVRHEAPIKRWNNHTRKAQHSAVAVLERCCIEGDVHLPGGLLDMHYTYTRELPAFFAL